MRKILSQRSKNKIKNRSLRRAAVLIILYKKDRNYYTILTKRSDKLLYHKAQISFPGGAYEEADNSLIDTAIRETYEEIGLNINHSDILGKLDDIVTITSKFVVSPFVALINYPFILNVNKNEIQEIIEIPLSFIINKDNLKAGTWEIDNRKEKGFYYIYNNHTIWGATARILKDFSEIFNEFK